MTEVFTSLSGDGSAVLAAPRFVPRLGVELTTVPGGVAVTSGGSPRRLMKAGWVSPSRIGSATGWPTTLFCEAAWWINFERQQMTYGVPGTLCDRVRYHFEPGVVASLYVDDAVVSTPVTAGLGPWDRNPALVNISAQSYRSGGSGSATLFTYTVPSARKLWVAKFALRCVRSAAASAVGGVACLGYIDAVTSLYMLTFTNAVGVESIEELPGAPLVLPAGTVVSATANNTDTGGQVLASGTLIGLLFDP